jgi:hypothetical protein
MTYSALGTAPDRAWCSDTLRPSPPGSRLIEAGAGRSRARSPIFVGHVVILTGVVAGLLDIVPLIRWHTLIPAGTHS